MSNDWGELMVAGCKLQVASCRFIIFTFQHFKSIIMKTFCLTLFSLLIFFSSLTALEFFLGGDIIL